MQAICLRAIRQIVKHHYPYHNKDTGTVTGTKVRITETKSFYATGAVSYTHLTLPTKRIV